MASPDGMSRAKCGGDLLGGGFYAPRCNPSTACGVPADRDGRTGGTAEPREGPAHPVQVDLQGAPAERLCAEADRGSRDRAHQPCDVGYQRGFAARLRPEPSEGSEPPRTANFSSFS